VGVDSVLSISTLLSSCHSLSEWTNWIHSIRIVIIEKIKHENILAAKIPIDFFDAGIVWNL